MADPQLRELNLRLVGIATILKDTLLRVPQYQRSYSWQSEQVTVFWRDLQAAMIANTPDYFMGTVVLSSDDPSADSSTMRRVTVVDGQQRLATVSVLLTCIRDVLRAAGEHNRAATVEASFLTTHDLRADRPAPRIQLNDEDSDFFQSSILEGSQPPAEFEFASNRRLIAARQTLMDLLQKEVDLAGQNWLHRLIDWIIFLQDRVRVISIQVETEADAFLIFETLNDRGLSLTIADLLKNHLLSSGNASPKRQEMHTAWMTMLSAFPVDKEDETSGDDLVTTFIRHYWSSLHGATRERELYSSLKRRIRGAEPAADLVFALADNAPSYAALLDPEHYRWQDLGISRDLTDSILRFGLEQPRPLFLAAMDSFDPDELRKLLTASVAWLTRGLIVGGVGGGRNERYYAIAAQGVRSRQLRTAEAVAEALEPIIPGDEVFQAAFSDKRVNGSTLAKYYIAALEAQYTSRPTPSIVSDADMQSTRLVHVLPRRADPDEWPEFPVDNISQWAIRLANQVLVEPSLSSRYVTDQVARLELIGRSNRPFASDIPRISGRWGRDELTYWQKNLASIALLTWPRHV